MEHQGVTLFLQVLKRCLESSKSDLITCIPILLHLLCNLMEQEESISQFQLDNGLNLLNQLILHYTSLVNPMESERVDSELLNPLEAAGTFLESLIENEMIQREIVTEDILKAFLSLVNKCTCILRMERQDDSDMDSLLQIIKVYCHVVTVTTLNGKFYFYF